jgi:hypothetical protein
MAESSITDSDIPPAPAYSLRPTGHGGVDVVDIGFQTMLDTATITSGSLTLYYWNELNGAAESGLAAGVDEAAVTCSPLAGATFLLDDVLQIDGEALLVSRAPGSDGTLTLERGVLSSVASTHQSNAAIYKLTRRTYVMPFPQRFFGSPASGAYAYGIDLADVRIAAAEFFTTNRIGAGAVQSVCYANTTPHGLRTLAGGQFCFQVAGIAAVQNDAGPKVTVDRTRSIAEVFATVNVAPSGGDVIVAVTQSDIELCRATIADGATLSNTVDGGGLALLTEGATLNVNIVAVPTGVNSMPGQELTVTIKL